MIRRVQTHVLRFGQHMTRERRFFGPFLKKGCFLLADFA
jgi:hypothetical protein